MRLTTLSIIPCLVLAGCTSTYVTYETPQGGKLVIHRRTLLSNVQMPSVKFGTNEVEMTGYSNNGMEGVNGIVEAATKGAVKGVTGK